MKEDFDNGENLTREQIGKDYDVELKKIRAGNSIELLRRGESLQRAKKRKIESADAHRKMQIRNINELYDWEIAEAEARYARDRRRGWGWGWGWAWAWQHACEPGRKG